MALSLDDLQRFPKAELHRHLDGAVPKPLVRRLALRDGLGEFRTRTGTAVPVSDEAAFDRFYQICDASSLEEMFARFDLVLAVMQTPENIEEVCYEVTLDVARKNIWYVEWTMAPAYHTRQGLAVREVVASALRGLARGRKDTGVLGKLILGIQREAVDKKKPEDARDPLGLEIARTAIEFRDQGVVALGLVCDESSYPPELYEEAFRLTRETPLKRTIHAGEMGTARARNVRTAVEKLHAHGIGHGIPVGQDPELIALLQARGVRLEANPLSNLLAGFIASLEELRLDRLLGAGVLVSINSDDPVLFRKELAENFQTVLDFYAWEERELAQFTDNALRSAFMKPEEYKERLAFFKTR